MDRLQFSVNGESHSVGCDVSSDVTLVDYLRNTLELRGTKYMCREGGCGACIVTAVKCPGGEPLAVNSCLVSITSCQDWDITTIEGVGNKHDGYHLIQKTLADFNGTQCGHCTPGWVMSMYSLLSSKKERSMLEIERSFGSNTCRCTGYRPILDAFKKFAKDAPTDLKIQDIEDIQLCRKKGKLCAKTKCPDDDEWCVISERDVKEPGILEISLKDRKEWYRVHEVADIFHILHLRGVESYMLVAGNTAKGVYPIDDYPEILIDISAVAELKKNVVDQNLVIGAGLTLTEILNIFENMSDNDYFTYLKKFIDHIKLVAHIPVRNLGTIGGNLMIKHQHNDFQSDIFLLLETVGAQLTIENYQGISQVVPMKRFLKTSMKGSIILNILLPPLTNVYKMETYKVMPRAQNAHAIVNAGFLYKLTNNNKVEEARIVYGGLSPTFIRASATEVYLKGKSLFTNATLQTALKILEHEIDVVENPPEPSADYRKRLAIGLFYKGLLSLCPPELLHARYASGSIRLRESRPVSNGRQIFDTNPALWPLNQPIPKVEALIQCSGEAKFTEDLPSFPREVFGAFVLTTVGLGTIANIDPSNALCQPGVIAFYTAKDIPGDNSFTPKLSNAMFYPNDEELLCNGSVKYFNQPLGIIVAETRHIAEQAAKLVNVTYKDVKQPVIDIRIAKNDPTKITLLQQNDAEKGTDIAAVVKFDNTIFSQYHFTMETIACVTVPTEEGLAVYPTSQWIDGIQVMTSRALKMQENQIDVHVRRIGGGYGIKVSRSNQAAVACNLIAYKLNRPCRFIQSLTTNTRACGKRLPCFSSFEVAVNSSGVIQYINQELYEDNGYIVNEPLAALAAGVITNCYDTSRWSWKCFQGITDTASNTFCRAPGTLEAIAMAEIVMERLCYELSLDPIEVRLANIDPQHNELKAMVEDLKSKASYDQRLIAVNKFNAENRWKKRGLRVAMMRWTPLGGQYLDINISVYYDDGSVVLTHGGIEMGQGINTKAVQVCAYLLKIPISKVQIKENNTIIAPNGFVSGGSLTSQNVAAGVQRCCRQLLDRLEPVRARMDNPTWEKLVRQAYDDDVDLQAHGYVSLQEMQDYHVYGVTIAEVEIDILTGEHNVLRVDLLEDAGLSLSPEVDVGQVEGAFVMGLGYWTSEELVYTSVGELLTDRTWNYHVPLATDIPLDLRVYFRNKSYSKETWLGSKAIGEPPMCMSIVIAFCIRAALASARLDAGIKAKKWFDVDGPFTQQVTCSLAGTKYESFLFN